MHLLFVRHARVGRQASLYGSTDVDLAGDAFAHLEPWLPEETLGFSLYSSPSTRAVETAKWLTADRGIDIITDKRLEERRLGKMEGEQYNGTNSQPAYWAVDPTISPEGGESFFEMAERIELFLADIRQRSSNAICLTHGGPLRALLYNLLGIPLDRVGLVDFSPLYGVSLRFHPGELKPYAIGLGQPFFRATDASA